MDNTHVGLDVSTVLLIVFIVLKLVGVIHWSWIWVLSPLWISWIFIFIIYIYIIIRYKENL